MQDLGLVILLLLVCVVCLFLLVRQPLEGEEVQCDCCDFFDTPCPHQGPHEYHKGCRNRCEERGGRCVRVLAITLRGEVQQ